MNPKRLKADARKAGALAAVGSALLVLGGLLAALTHGQTRLAALGLVLIGVAVLGFRVLQWWQLATAERVERRRDEQAARLGLRGPPVRMTEFSVEDAGADRLQVPVDYIARTAEQEVARQLEDAKNAALQGQGKRMVIVAGASKAGKSRLLIEAARKVLPDWVVIRPTPTRLADCLRADAVPDDIKLDRVILWLDDVEPFARLGPDALNAGTLSAYLDEFAETPNCGVVILATRGGKGRDTSTDPDDPSRFMSALAELEPLSHVVELAERLDESELADAARVLAPLSLWNRSQVERSGLGAYLVGGPALMTMLQTGRGHDGSTNRAGQHVAWLVAWWAHIGIVEPVTRAQLRVIWQACPDPEAGPASGAIDAALEWARTPLVPSRPAVALVCGSDDEGYWPYDYVRSRVAEAGTPPFDAARLNETILGLATSAQLFDIGWSAYHRTDAVLAENAWLRLLRRQENDPVLGPLVAFGLGLLLKQKGETNGAIKMFELALRSEHPDAAPRASNSIAHILWDRNELDAANARFRALLDSGHPEVAPASAYDLGLLLERDGDLEAAEAAYRTAIDSRHPRIAPRAAVNLGGLLWREGKGDAAIDCFEVAISFGNQEQSAKAYMNIARAKLDTEDTAGVEAALEHAFAQHHPQISPTVGCRLGQVRWQRADLDGAATAFRAASAYVDSDDGWEARLGLGALLEEADDPAGAQAEYEAVLGCGRPHQVASAGFHLGEILATAGNRQGAMQAYQQAMDCHAGRDSRRLSACADARRGQGLHARACRLRAGTRLGGQRTGRIRRAPAWQSRRARRRSQRSRDRLRTSVHGGQHRDRRPRSRPVGRRAQSSRRSRRRDSRLHARRRIRRRPDCARGLVAPRFPACGRRSRTGSTSSAAKRNRLGNSKSAPDSKADPQGLARKLAVRVSGKAVADHERSPNTATGPVSSDAVRRSLTSF